VDFTICETPDPMKRVVEFEGGLFFMQSGLTKPPEGCWMSLAGESGVAFNFGSKVLRRMTTFLHQGGRLKVGLGVGMHLPVPQDLIFGKPSVFCVLLFWC